MTVNSGDELREILARDRIAVVGCSTTPGKAAHDVPRYLQEHGYDVIPVNPFADSVLGVRSYDDLGAVPDGVEIVDVFRPSEEVAGIVDAALDRDDCDVIWLQQGIRDDEAAARAEDAGRQVIQDRCMKVEHARLVGGADG